MELILTLLGGLGLFLFAESGWGKAQDYFGGNDEE